MLAIATNVTADGMLWPPLPPLSRDTAVGELLRWLGLSAHAGAIGALGIRTVAHLAATSGGALAAVGIRLVQRRRMLSAARCANSVRAHAVGRRRV
jgi:hypothetical protein